MWPYSWTHVGTPSHLGHMDRVAATMPSQAHAGAAQEAPNIGQWEGQDVPLVRPSSCTVKGGIPSSRRYLPTFHKVLGTVPVHIWSSSTRRHVGRHCRMLADVARIRAMCPRTLRNTTSGLASGSLLCLAASSRRCLWYALSVPTASAPSMNDSQPPLSADSRNSTNLLYYW